VLVACDVASLFGLAATCRQFACLMCDDETLAILLKRKWPEINTEGLSPMSAIRAIHLLPKQPKGLQAVARAVRYSICQPADGSRNDATMPYEWSPKWIERETAERGDFQTREMFHVLRDNKDRLFSMWMEWHDDRASYRALVRRDGELVHEWDALPVFPRLICADNEGGVYVCGLMLTTMTLFRLGSGRVVGPWRSDVTTLPICHNSVFGDAVLPHLVVTYSPRLETVSLLRRDQRLAVIWRASISLSPKYPLMLFDLAHIDHRLVLKLTRRKDLKKHRTHMSAQMFMVSLA